VSQSQPGYGLDLDERINSSITQWKRTAASISRALRAGLPCIVVSFDEDAQTVTVQPTTTESTLLAGIPTPVALPQLTDVPVLLPRAGGFTLTMPITAGDECFVLFADTNIDAWLQSGGSGNNQINGRRHSLADGIAIFGPWSQPRVLTAYSTTSVQLRSDDGTVIVDVAAAAVTITAPTVTVNASTAANVNAPTVHVTASTTAYVTAPTVDIAGETAVNITGGHCSIDGTNFLLHDHFTSGITGPTTGPVA
jgi:phage baseplate assembly protein gpV